MICTRMDDYVRSLELERKQALWRVQLSGGDVVVQDDGRPGLAQPSAWIRLAEHLARTDQSIVRMWLAFRNNEKRCLPDNADGYYFCKSVLGALSSRETYSFVLVGHLRGEKVMVQRWHVPALLLIANEEREASKAGDCLIRSRHAFDRQTRPLGPDERP